MKRLLVLIAAVMLFSASPTFALFTNGGFETGDLTGWTIDYGRRNIGTATVNWSLSGDGGDVTAGVWTASDTFPGQDGGFDLNPYNGSYSARLGDLGGGFHATKISQTDTITQADIDAGAIVYVNWGAILVEPFNAHPVGDQPFFGIDVTVDGTTSSFFADALSKQGGGWTDVGDDIVGSPLGGDIWYKSGTYSVDLSAFSVGDSVTVWMQVADCGWGGHGGFALLDGIGTTRQPIIPAPGAILLGSIGVGLVSWLRRRRTL